MKNLKTFEDFINEPKVFIHEAASWNLDVEEPYINNEEKKAMTKFKIIVDPIVVTKVDGFLSDDKSDIIITFSNGDTITYKYRYAPVNSMLDIEFYSKELDRSVDWSNYADKYFGSTDTVIGDLCLMYNDSYYGKLK